MNRSWFHNHYIFIKVFFRIFFLSICFPGNVLSQEDASLSSLRFDHLNFSNGLSFNVVNSIIKDKKGFIWISTQDGLNRYDGVNFKVYRHDNHNPNSLASSGVYQMTLDSKGNIWMATDAALSEYIPATDSFKNFFVATRSKSRSAHSPYVDSDDVVWFGDNDGLCRLNSDGKIQTFPIKHLLKRFSIGAIIEDEKGIIWIGTIQGLYSFNKQTHIFKRYLFDTGGEEANSITCLIQDQERNIWVGSWGNGIAKFDRQTGKFEIYKYSVEENIVWSIYESSEQEGKLWIGTAYQGVAVFDKQKKSFEFASINPNDVNAFNAYGVNQIFNDHLGTLWFAGTNGVVKLDKYKQQFRTQIVEPIRTSAGKGITGIIADTFHADKLLWLSTYRHGIICYSATTGKFTVFSPHPGNAISNQLVNSMVQDHEGKFWIATSNGFNRFDPETKTFTVYKHIPGKNSLPMNDINHLLLSKEGKVWMTVRGNGFCSFDPQTKHFNWYRKISDENNDSINNSVFCLTQDHKGVIWGGTQFGGMFSFNPKTQKFFIYNLKNHFTNQTVYDILESADQTIWIASENGLWNLNPASKLLKQYTTAEGLPNDNCLAIQQDQQQRLWIATLNGLSLFDQKKNHFENYTTNDGLIDNEAGSSFDKGDDGKFYIGYDDSYNYFNPNNIIKNDLPPPIVFTSFKIFGKEMAPPEENDAKNVMELNYKQNMLSFEFAALNYTVPQKNQYAYKLEGADKDWTYSGSGRQATYSNLSGGDYVFHVKAANNDGVWNEEGKSMFIHIASPFWGTSWFRIFVITILISAGYLFYRRRILFIRKQEERKTAFNKQLAQIEMKALKAQMNPHFIFNCLNSINSYILENDKKMASDYLTKFSTLIRLILENSDKQKINLDDELEMLTTYLQLEQNRLDNKFDYYIHVDPSIKTTAFEIPSLILQPFIENAIWHGVVHKNEKGKIDISIKKESNTLLCIIEDNGIGRSKAAALKKLQLIKHESMAMKVTEDRLKILNELNLERPAVTILDLFDENEQPSGTRAEIIIPV